MRRALWIVAVPFAFAALAAAFLLRPRAVPEPLAAASPSVWAAAARPSTPAAAPLPHRDAAAAVAACPLLTPAAFETMSANVPLAALGADEVALLAVGFGDQGLASMQSSDAAEIGRHFADVFRTMSVEERDTFAAAVSVLRDGRSLPAAQASAAAESLRRGAGGLGPDARERLRSLYSAAIESSFAARAAATERTRAAAALAAAQPTGVPTPSAPSAAARAGNPFYGNPATDDHRAARANDAALAQQERSREAQEIMWRRRRTDAEARVRTAEAALAEAERAAAHVRSLGPNGGLGTDGDVEAYRAGVITALQLRDRMRAREERERAAGPGSSRTSSPAMTVPQATANLTAARAALDRLDDEARKAGVPAGWVR